MTEKKRTLLKINYKNGNLLCQVEVTLQGITNVSQAQWVWEQVILPVLNKEG